MQIKARGKTLDVTNKTAIVGVINLSPDSFSGDGLTNPALAMTQAKKLRQDGADILDIGGESTRPGSVSISVDEELSRVLPVVLALAKDPAMIISVDTYKPQVAKQALQAGAHIINDITGLANKDMQRLVASYRAGVVIMHMLGTPKIMQQNPRYADVVEDIKTFFRDRIMMARQAGISDDQIIVDPGIGFGKTVEHNVAILRQVATLGYPFDDGQQFPVLIGPSRKTFLGQLTGKDNPRDRIFGTAAAVAVAIQNGASLVRVHDVAAIRDVTLVTDAIVSPNLATA